MQTTTPIDPAPEIDIARIEFFSAAFGVAAPTTLLARPSVALWRTPDVRMAPL